MLLRAKNSIKHNKLYYYKNINKFIHYFKAFNIAETKK